MGLRVSENEIVKINGRKLKSEKKQYILLNKPKNFSCRLDDFGKKNSVFELIKNKEMPKGDPITLAEVSAVLGVKKTSELIPLCHPLALTSAELDLRCDEKHGIIKITSKCKINARTGVEMEALTAVSIAALTIYDMCKAVDKGIIINNIRLLEKTGGKSGQWRGK